MLEFEENVSKILNKVKSDILSTMAHELHNNTKLTLLSQFVYIPRKDDL